jgi:hypothetical protein
MRARISIALGLYWSSVAQAIDIIAAISALGSIGGLPPLLNALTKYARFIMRQLQGVRSRIRRHLRSAVCAMRHESICT